MSNNRPPVVLTIAGSDPSGGAGLQTDIKAITLADCHAMTAVTAVTVQCTRGVESYMPVPVDIVRAQIRRACDDIAPDAVKTGMLADAATVTAVAEMADTYGWDKLVVDPVLVATSGDALADDGCGSMAMALLTKLMPKALLITPNYSEARELTGETRPEEQVKTFRSYGIRNILIKGGDDPDSPEKSIDRLWLAGDDAPFELVARRVDTRNTHGTGCTLSAAIAANLAKGYSLKDAIAKAKCFISEALTNGASKTLGHGHGPCLL